MKKVRKMKISQESGIKIDEELRKIIGKALEKAGGRVNRLARLSGCKQPSVDRWVGKNQEKSDIISWDAWTSFRDYLVSTGLLKAGDPKWMTPSELLEYVKAIAPMDENESRLLILFRSLNEGGKSLAIQTLENMASNPATSDS